MLALLRIAYICDTRNQAKNFFKKTCIQRMLQLIILMPLFVWYCVTSLSLLCFRPPKGSSPPFFSPYPVVPSTSGYESRADCARAPESMFLSLTVPPAIASILFCD